MTSISSNLQDTYLCACACACACAICWLLGPGHLFVCKLVGEVRETKTLHMAACLFSLHSPRTSPSGLMSASRDSRQRGQDEWTMTKQYIHSLPLHSHFPYCRLLFFPVTSVVPLGLRPYIPKRQSLMRAGEDGHGKRRFHGQGLVGLLSPTVERMECASF